MIGAAPGAHPVRPLQARSKRSTADDLAADPRYGMLGFKAGDTVCEPAGCERCGGTGYRGRSGVFECLEMTETGARA